MDRVYRIQTFLGFLYFFIFTRPLSGDMYVKLTAVLLQVESEAMHCKSHLNQLLHPIVNCLCVVEHC